MKSRTQRLTKRLERRVLSAVARDLGHGLPTGSLRVVSVSVSGSRVIVEFDHASTMRRRFAVEAEGKAA